jgi:hypothetical protein
MSLAYLIRMIQERTLSSIKTTWCKGHQGLLTLNIAEMTEQFEWAAPEKGWRMKDGKLIPFNELTDAQLNKYFKLSQHKEMVYANKSYVFADKASEIEEEAEKRGIKLKSLDTEYHNNSNILKGK